jgi:hypothetical protein
MNKTPRVTTHPDISSDHPLRRNTLLGSGNVRKSVMAGLAFLVVLLIVLVWIGLTRQSGSSPQTVLTTHSGISQVIPPRRDANLAYDSVHHEVLLFGGTLLTSGGAQTNETWAWNGQTWTQLHPTASPPALPGTMVYDAASQQIILFLYRVQSGGTVANEMWTWDGNTWHQLQPTVLPEVLDASIAYDAAQGQIVLFGSETSQDTGTLTNSTWTWNGTIWQEQHPPTSPSPRTGAALAYDAARQQIVLYGGITATGLSSEIWTWNGTTWQQHQVTNQPSARQHASLVYDNATQQTLLFGGLNPQGTQPAPDDTWAWNGNTWSQLSPQGAPTDLYQSAVYDETTKTVLVYAVQGSLNKLETPNVPALMSQTWIWDGRIWKLLK